MNKNPLSQPTLSLPVLLTLNKSVKWLKRQAKMEGMIDSGLVGSGRGTTIAEPAQGTPSQSHISPSILVHEENPERKCEMAATPSQNVRNKLLGDGRDTKRVLHRNMQRFRGGLVFKARRLYVSLNSRLESNKEEEECVCVSVFFFFVCVRERERERER